MGKKIRLQFSVLTFSILLSGCYTNSFLPQTQNVPLFTEKNQLHINPSHSLRAFDLGVAYSPTNFLGVMVNLQATEKYKMAEIGVGAFKKSGNLLVTEIYLGYGNGYIDTDVMTIGVPLSRDHKELQISMNANKIFLQPNLGLTFNKNVNLSLSTKCTYWSYTNYYYYREDFEYHNGSNFRTGKDSVNGKNVSCITIEPALTFRVGGPHTKFMFQAGTATPIDDSQRKFNPFRNNEGFVRVGVSVNFGLFQNNEPEIPAGN